MNSSGNLLADRRFAWARALADEGDHGAAADLLAQVIDLAPGWAAAWAALAKASHCVGNKDAAATAWHRAAMLDDDGRLGAGLQAAVLDGRTPDAMPDAYVEALFDGYAPRFQDHLVGRLNYCGPQRVLDALAKAGASLPGSEALDLGCGTGLMGQALRGHVAAVDGIDLSARMVDLARAQGVYRDLWVGPLLDLLLESRPGRYGLITAADVLVYVGDLVPLMAGVARVLAPGGLFAFTVQVVPEGATGSPGFVLGPDLRFSHSRSYVDDALALFEFQPAAVMEAWARTENGLGVPGLVAVAGRT